MTSAIAIVQGHFGRAALLDMDGSLVTHAHHQCHAIFKSGGADQRFAVKGRPYPVSDETAILVNTWEEHAYTHPPGAPGTTFLALYVEPKWLAGFDHSLISCMAPAFFPRPCVRITPGIRRRADRLGAAMCGAGGPDPGEIENLVFDLMISLIDRFSEWRRLRTAHPSGERYRDVRIHRAISHMRRDVGRSLDIDRLAAVARLSRSRFNQLFKRSTGLTPAIYANVLRVDRAIEGLKDGRQPIAELAHDIGCSAQSNFTRFFRQHVGVTPSDYRKVVSLLDDAR